MGVGPQARRHQNKETMKEDQDSHEGSFTEATASIEPVMARGFSIEALTERLQKSTGALTERLGKGIGALAVIIKNMWAQE